MALKGRRSDRLLTNVSNRGKLSGRWPFPFPVLVLTQPFGLGYVNDRGFAPKSNNATSKFTLWATKSTAALLTGSRGAVWRRWVLVANRLR
jgi:hypothetical protein